MAGEYTAVGLGTQTPDIMQKLSNVLAIKGQQQALQGQAAEVAGAQQAQRQRQGIAGYDFNKHLASDGTPDVHGMASDPALREAAGDQFYEVLGKAASLKQQQLQNMQTLTLLRGDQRAAFGELMNGLRNDQDVAQDNDAGRQKLNQALIQYGEMYGEDALPVIQAYAGQLKGVPKGKLPDALRVVGMQAQAVSGQMAAQAPSMANTGSELRNLNPNAVGAPASVPLTLSPGELNTPIVDQFDNSRILQRTPRGAIVGTPATPGMPQLAPGELLTIGANASAIATRVAQTQEQANQSPQALDALGRARTLLDIPDLDTGKGFEKFTSLKNYLAGIGFDVQGATDANSLVKNLARYEASRATASGLGHTDAARTLAHTGSPNTSIDKKALKGIVTQSMATEMTIAGKAKIQAGVSDPAKLAANEKSFRDIPNVIQAYEYGLARNPEEAEHFLKEHGLDHKEIAESRAKLRKLGAL